MTVSTKLDDPLAKPPVVGPRARTVSAPVRLIPVSSHPPGIRVPEPKLLHDAPASVVRSKETYKTSGAALLRIQFRVELLDAEVPSYKDFSVSLHRGTNNPRTTIWALHRSNEIRV